MRARSAGRNDGADDGGTSAFLAGSAAVHLVGIAIASVVIGGREPPRVPEPSPPRRPLLVALAEFEPAPPAESAPWAGRPDGLPADDGPVEEPAWRDAGRPAGSAPPRTSSPRPASPRRVGPSRAVGESPAPQAFAADASPDPEPPVAGDPVAGPVGTPEPASSPRAPAAGDPSAGMAGETVFEIGDPDEPMLVTLGSTDPRYSDYLGRIAALLEPEWRNAFPRERALYMQQGEIVIEWTVGPGGEVGELRVIRTSRVPVFDRNVLAGFRRAAERFPAPPPSMPLPLRIRAPFRFNNPMFE